MGVTPRNRMKTPILHLATWALLVAGILFESVLDITKRFAAQELLPFVRIGAGMLLNFLFIGLLLFVAYLYFRGTRSTTFRVVYAVLGLLLLLLSVPPLWFLRMPARVLPYFQLPALPESFVAMACTFWVVANLFGRWERPQAG